MGFPKKKAAKAAVEQKLTPVDAATFSYAMGVGQSESLKSFLLQREGVDSAYIAFAAKAMMEASTLSDEEIKQKEIDVAIEKTKAEQVQKAVEAALKKAGINPDHMESNMTKGWITAEDVAKAKEIIATVSEEKAANLPEQMIQNIAKGRLGKFLKEVCLLNQEDIMDGKKTVREVLKEADPELKVVDFKRFTLRAE